MGHPTGGNGFGIGEVLQREDIFARALQELCKSFARGMEQGWCLEAMEVSDRALRLLWWKLSYPSVTREQKHRLRQRCLQPSLLVYVSHTSRASTSLLLDLSLPCS
jgi:hypothetical protein